MKRSIASLLFLLTVTATAIAQGSMSAKVVDVIDGRTLVIETAAGRMNAQLQYVEIPEPDQPLYKVVRDHLAKLTVGRSVEFRTERIMTGNAVGRMTIDGVDLSVQMIRDGAAWHEPATTSGQNPLEAADYAENQNLAKSEKRGVWSVPDLKTPWELRAERNTVARQNEAARRIAHPTLVGVGEFQSDIRRPSGNHGAPRIVSERQKLDAWVGAFANMTKENYGLQTYNDPQGRYNTVHTSPILLDFGSSAGKERLECRPIFYTFTYPNGARQHLYVIGFRAISSDYRYSKARSRLTVYADGRAIGLGAPRGFRDKHLIGAEEIMFYFTSWATLKKIGDARRVEFRIDKLQAQLKDADRDLIKQLATATQ